MGHRELLQRTAHTEAVRPSTDNAPQGMMVPAAGFAKDGKVHPRLVSLAHVVFFNQKLIKLGDGLDFIGRRSHRSFTYSSIDQLSLRSYLSYSL